MKQDKVRILDINPHNVFLAEEPINWLRGHYKQIKPIDVCVYKNDMLSNDGDHRLYVLHKNNRIYTPANIYDLDNPQDIITLQELKETQNLEYLAKETGMDIEAVREIGPKPKKTDLVEELEEVLEFVRSLGINSIADLAKKKILPTKEDIQNAYWILKKEFNEGRR